MKKIILFLLSSVGCLTGFGQKPSLRVDSYKKWSHLGFPGISNDGKFFFYRTESNSDKLFDGHYTIGTTDKKWIEDLGAITDPRFSENSRKLLSKLANDTLMILDLYSNSKKKIDHVKGYKLFMIGKNEWVVASIDDNKSSLVLFPLNNRQRLQFNRITNYYVNPDKSSLVIQQTCIEDPESERLIWVDLIASQTKVIYEGEVPTNLIFDKTGLQLAFFVKKSTKNTIWYFNKTKVKASSLLGESFAPLDSLKIQQPNPWGPFWSFSNDGKRLFFSLGSQEKPSKWSNPNLIIWNFKDAFLQTDELSSRRKTVRSTQFLASLLVSNKTVKRLTYKYDLIVDKYLLSQPGPYILIETTADSIRENTYVDFNRKKSFYLCSTETGKRVPVILNSKFLIDFIRISPKNRYVVYFDREKETYCCYSILNKRTTMIARTIPESLNNNLGFSEITRGSNLGIAGWLPGDKALIINGSRNLYLVDPEGNNKLYNLTARKKDDRQIIFNLPIKADVVTPDSEGNILCYAFDVDNKKIALHNLRLEQKMNLMELNFQPLYSAELEYAYTKFSDHDMIKARDVSSYIIRWESINSAPNYFFTTDLKKYTSLSNVQPHINYNWMTSELHKYRDKEGNNNEGILYKPENFDPAKKYPIVFNYYELKSNQLNQYVPADDIHGDIPIAYLVSNGYLVFKANIISRPTKVGAGALNSVNAAADYITKYTWVDSTKMAVSGHSFGGFETFYIITHSNRFAAALSASGISNLISYYYNDGLLDSDFDGIKMGQMKMKVSPEDSVSLYIENSPLLRTRAVKTPTLIMHNPLDNAASFSNSLAFFRQLRNYKKPVWMLSYKNDKHGIGDDNAVDYYTRVAEFFEHYLKVKPMPEWMNSPIGQ
jgi:dipeptidyl aminopeptidase/acylaminoacyl peptidase